MPQVTHARAVDQRPAHEMVLGWEASTREVSTECELLYTVSTTKLYHSLDSNNDVVRYEYYQDNNLMVA